MTKTIQLRKIAYHTSSSTLPGQDESGDLYFIRESDNRALVAVIDGMGHGPEAASAAKLAVNIIEANSELSIIALSKMCHEKLLFTRGAVMALATINYDDETLTWLSIGDVEGILLHTEPLTNPVYESIFKCPGALGYKLPQLRAKVETITKGDMLIFTTDGIKNDYPLNIASYILNVHEQDFRSDDWSKDEVIKESIKDAGKPVFSKRQAYSAEFVLFAEGSENVSPDKMTRYIAERYTKGTDDALVTVIKYLGYG